MSDDHGGGGGQRQCRRSVAAEVELGAALALADMAGLGPGAPLHDPGPAQLEAAAEQQGNEVESTRLSLELGRVGIQSSSCSSSSSAGRPPAAAAGHGPRPRHMLTEAEKEAKRLRRVLANRESARQTILRRQAIRDELARKVTDLSSENETMKKEKETVIREYLTLKETNKQLKEQVARTAGTKAAAAAAGTVTTAMDTAPSAREGEAMETTVAPPPPTTTANFAYAAAPPVVPVPYVWGSWSASYEHGDHGAPATLCLPPCAWYCPFAADQRGSPTSHEQPLQGPTSGDGGKTAEEDTDDDPCSLTLALDVDTKSTPSGRSGGHAKAATAAEARRRRKELKKLKHAAGSRPGGDQATRRSSGDGRAPSWI